MGIKLPDLINEEKELMVVTQMKTLLGNVVSNKSVVEPLCDYLDLQNERVARYAKTVVKLDSFIDAHVAIEKRQQQVIDVLLAHVTMTDELTEALTQVGYRVDVLRNVDVKVH